MIGGGVIGVEIGTIYASFGTEVTMVELMDQILPGLSKDIIRPVESNLRKLGVKLYLNSKTKGYNYTDEGVEIKIETESKEEKRKKIILPRKRRNNKIGVRTCSHSQKAKHGWIKP